MNEKNMAFKLQCASSQNQACNSMRLESKQLLLMPLWSRLPAANTSLKPRAGGVVDKKCIHVLIESR